MAITCLDTTARRSSRANSRGSDPCSASECASRVIPENDVVAAPARISTPEIPTTTSSTSTRPDGSDPSNAAAMPTSGASSHSSPSAVSPFVDRVRGEPDRPDEHGDEHDEPDRGEERARKRASGLGRLLSEVRDGLEARVREHREREREGEVAPVLAASEAEPFRERLRREQQGEPEEHENALHEEVEQRDREPAEVETRAACGSARRRSRR